MLRNHNLKLLRYYSSWKPSSPVLSSGQIREKFLDYFINQNDHKFIRSSPVVPFCDPTVAFVNAGMNQFKSIFLGKSTPNSRRATNSQKCVRVGGKHNDLSVVGEDGYHHTFFEMLGNWSFGDYFKKEACTMALELLKGPYGMDTSRMYVTYFAGDEKLGLGPDLECFEIWKSLGFPEERILPFGSKDNFWEMGASGPCGPCTEIHYDHRPDLATGPGSRGRLVNAGTPDLTEIWNLVFIQYNRTGDGAIIPLPEKHVDTGMGFERLTAILQNKSSNYDTDLFSPIMDSIHKISKAPAYSGQFEQHNLDTAYRILSDHSRMITACLADGMLPDQNQKLRRVLRKAFQLSENTFKNENLLHKLVPVVVDILGPTYPEMQSKMENVREIIQHEQEIFKALRQSSSQSFKEVLTVFPDLDDIDLMESPGFVPAFKEVKAIKDQLSGGTIPGQFLFKLSDTYGLSEYSMEKLADIYNLKLDKEGLREEIYKAKQKTKGSFNEGNTQLQKRIDAALASITQKCANTDNSYKYSYRYNNTKKVYEVLMIQGKIQTILHDDVELESVDLSKSDTKSRFSIVMDKSNFYFESGGQESDSGHLLIKTAAGNELKFIVESVLSVNNCIVHIGHFEKKYEGQICVGDLADLHVDEVRRTDNIMNHTSTHLLNSAVRTLFNKVTYQISSSVTAENLKLELGIIGKKILKEDVEAIEQLIRKIIKSDVPLEVSIINAADVLKRADITLVPGEIYPENNLRLVSLGNDEIGCRSTELCCGTHIQTSGHLQNVCITNVKQTNRARYAFTAVAGRRADDALSRAKALKLRVDVLEEEFRADTGSKLCEIDNQLQKVRNSILHTDIVLPYVFKQDILQRISDILKQTKEASRNSLKEFVDYEMKSLLQDKPADKYPYIVHYLRTSALMEEVPLQRATKICSNRPVLVVSVSDGVIKARCCVPKSNINEEFSAQKWLNQFASPFKAQVSVPKGQNGDEVCNMRGRKVAATFEEQLEMGMHLAEQFASKQV